MILKSDHDNVLEDRDSSSFSHISLLVILDLLERRGRHQSSREERLNGNFAASNGSSYLEQLELEAWHHC